MKKMLILILVLALVRVNAQNDSLHLIGVHPAIGKVMDGNEKRTYQLLPGYIDSLFAEARVYRCADSTYRLEVTTKSGTVVSRAISTPELDEMYAAVQSHKHQQPSDAELREEEEEERRRRRHDAFMDVTGQVFVSML